MPRYVAFLRGVMPNNPPMAALRDVFDGLGFSAVRTVLGSGNVVFETRRAVEGRLERRIEAATAPLGRTLRTMVRSQDALRTILRSDPYVGLRLPPGAKRIVVFLKQPPVRLPTLPIAQDGAQIVRLTGREAFVFYVPGPKAPEFLRLIEGTFSKDVTTRTWETVSKCAAADE